MKIWQTLSTGVACLVLIGPIRADMYLDQIKRGGRDGLAVAVYATQYCHLNNGSRDIELNTDRVLLDIGAERMAAGISKIQAGEDRFFQEQLTPYWSDGWRMRIDDCSGWWKRYGPDGLGWLREGSVNAGKDLERSLTDRERELKAQPVQMLSKSLSV